METQFFFSTAPVPCPYLPGRFERRLVTELIGGRAVTLHERLLQAGYRRSHQVAYTPVCNDCDACKAVRVIIPDFALSRSQRRVWKRNSHLSVKIIEPMATEEQFSLFLRYQHARHDTSDMAKMDFSDYQGLIEDSPVETLLVEYRNLSGELVAICLADRVQNGLSAVYNFFNPDMKKDSLGTYMVLWLIKEATRIRLNYVYLGYWISGCGKMDYKAKFFPIEVLINNDWRKLE